MSFNYNTFFTLLAILFGVINLSLFVYKSYSKGKKNIIRKEVFVILKYMYYWYCSILNDKQLEISSLYLLWFKKHQFLYHVWFTSYIKFFISALLVCMNHKKWYVQTQLFRVESSEVNDDRFRQTTIIILRHTKDWKQHSLMFI